MACCGQKRDAVRAQVRATPRVSAAAPAPVRADHPSSVTLQYRHRSPITVRGATTGRRYEFLCGGALQAVDAQDADALIATGMFDRIRS